MSEQEEKLKAQNEKGQDDNPTMDVVTPPGTEGEEEIKPETAVQQAKTFRGMLKKTQEELATLTRERADYQGLGLKIDSLVSQVGQQGQTLDLVTEILSTSAEASEELQKKVKIRQEEQERRAKEYAESQEALTTIKGIYEAAGMKHNDEALTPAREAYRKGDYKGALNLTIVAVKGRILAPPSEKPAGEKEGSPELAKRLKVITQSPAPGKSVEDMTPTEKIKAGIQEARDRQGK